MKIAGSDITFIDFPTVDDWAVIIYFTGCSNNCVNCQNKELQNPDYKSSILSIQDEENLFNFIKDICKKQDTNKIVFSGGDPLDQDRLSLSELMQLIKCVRRNYPNKTIWLYTGYEYEKLNKYQKEIADSCDAVVDGPFIEEKKTFDCPFRGSSNQRIIKKGTS